MPSLNFGDAPPWLQWLLAVAGVVAFLGAVIRCVPPLWRFVTRFVNTINRLAALPDEQQAQTEFRKQVTDTLSDQDVKIAAQKRILDEQTATLRTIKYQVLPNGGGSMRDDVNAIKTHLAVNDSRIDGLEKKNEKEN